MAFPFRKLDCPRLSLSAELDVSTQTVNRGLDRKARVAVIVAVALLIAVPVYLIIKLVAAQLRAPERQQVLHPQEGQLVTLRDGSTMFIQRSSMGERMAAWLKLKPSGEQAFDIGNANFTPGSSTLTKEGWEHVIQFAQILEVNRGVRAVILVAPYHGDEATTKVEKERANRIREEVMKQGVNAEQIVVAREAFAPGHDPSRDEGLEVVLTNKG